jgi:hypothetical protein
MQSGGLCSKRGILIKYQLKGVSDAISEFNRSRTSQVAVRATFQRTYNQKKCGNFNILYGLRLGAFWRIFS